MQKNALRLVFKFFLAAMMIIASQAPTGASAASPGPGRVFLPALAGGDGMNMSDAAPADRAAAERIVEVLQSTPQAELQRSSGSRPSFTILAYALAVSGVGKTLLGTDTFTLFAPTDAAFRALPAGTLSSLLRRENRDQLRAILTYHALGSKVSAEQAKALAPTDVPTLNGSAIRVTTRDAALFINQSRVIAADIDFGQARVIHVIDAVLLPAAPTPTPTPTPQPTATPGPTPTPAPLKDIVDTAVAAGSFNTLVAAVQAAGLVDALKGPGPLTVFAPSDAAFAKLPPAIVTALLKPENKDKLIDILTYHVLVGRVLSPAALALDGQQVSTLNGKKISITVRNGDLFINESKVIAADVLASNGVIHVIDTVLIPPGFVPPPTKDIVKTAIAAGSFNTLVAAVQAAGLVDALKAPGPLTVFAPSDAAFAKLPPALVTALLKPENKDKLIDILTYHVLVGRVLSPAALALDGQQVGMLNGKKISITVRSGDLFINESKVIAADVLASNGVIHVIDTVLIPPGFVPPPTKDIVETAIAAGSFNTLVAAVQAAGLVDALKGPGPLTVFAPTDAAFAKLPPALVAALLKPENKDKLIDILTYHVLVGRVLSPAALALDGQQVSMLNGKKISITVRSGDLFINESKVIAADVLASNGVIHVIDTVLIPPGFVPPPTKDIVETAIAAGSFNTLVAAVQAAGLVDALKGPGPLTVFAPSDAAFAKLPPAVLSALLKPENKELLKAILLYHVVADDLSRAELRHGGSATTLNGAHLRFSRANTNVFVNGAKITAADILATNGRIHVIDRVLVPNVLITKMLALSGEYNTLLAAAKAADFETLLSLPHLPITLFAPNDAAFAKLPAGTVANLLKPENKNKLQAILANHIVLWDEVASSELLARGHVRTLYGRTVIVSQNSVGLVLNGNINVIAPDVDARNGIIHGIDAVILP